MVCGECGATIADKAIVCYRCGAPTETPLVDRPATPRRPLWAVALVLVLVATGLGWFALGSPEGSSQQFVLGAGAVLALALGALSLVRRG